MNHAACELWGNPSSPHREGRAARDALEQARRRVAGLLGIVGQAGQVEGGRWARHVLFTSGGTEGNNSAILGLCARANGAAERREEGCQQIITSPLEHPSVLAAVAACHAQGIPVTYLPVDARGRWDLVDLGRALQEGRGPALVTLALANHEIGNVYPIGAAARLCQERGALLHCDAVQAVGRIPVAVAELQVDALTCSAHKLGGPKGAGALVLSDAAARRLRPLLAGGRQEKGLRAGTQALPAVVGFGAACALRGAAGGPSRDPLDVMAARVAALRDRLEARLLRAIPGARVNGDARPGGRAPGTCNLAFAGVDGDLLMMALDLRGAAVSTGAACSSGSPEPSAVLRALGQEPAQAREAVRFSLGPGNDQAQIDQVAAWVEEIVAHIRGVPRP